MDDEEYMLTTVDNPYDPFTQFDEWDAYDRQAGYGTTAFIARLCRTSDELSDADQQSIYNDTINEIVNENVLGLYRKVSRSRIVDVPRQPTNA